MVAKESRFFCGFLFFVLIKSKQACAFVKLRGRSLVKRTNEQVIKGAGSHQRKERMRPGALVEAFVSQIGR